MSQPPPLSETSRGLDQTEPNATVAPTSSAGVLVSSGGNAKAVLTFDKLDVNEVYEWVGSDQAGAIASFLGTTRDNFNGRKVARLEYEAYTSMALKTMSQILETVLSSTEPSSNVLDPLRRDSGASTTTTTASTDRVPARTHTPNAPKPSTPANAGNVGKIIKACVYHRLGPVPVGETSIIIAVSSPHRKEAFVACEWVLEEVKKRAQVWKREWYEGEGEDEALWKRNF